MTFTWQSIVAIALVALVFIFVVTDPNDHDKRRW